MRIMELRYRTIALIFGSILSFLLSISDVNSTDEIVRYCNSTFDSRGGRGLCISFDQKLKNCPPLLHLLRDRKFTELKETFCDEPEPGESFDLSWVCCPEDDLIDISNEIFAEHPNFKLLPNTDLCGQSGNSDRIVGGTDANPGHFPWMARLAVKRDDNEMDEFACGGSLISQRYVLSAAHCFKDYVKPTKIRVGDTHEDAELECIEFGESKVCEKQEDYGIEDVILHPEYTGSTGSHHDIALVRLNRNIRNISSLFVRPICLPFTDEFHIPPLPIPTPGQNGNLHAIVSGWGKLYNSDTEGSPDLQFLSVLLTDNNQCGKNFKANNVTISEAQICAGGEKGKGSCAGDSGGPLFYPAKIKGKTVIRNVQIGIVSFGKHQCAGSAPVVYTRVRKYLSWILNNIKE